MSDLFEQIIKGKQEQQCQQISDFLLRLLNAKELSTQSVTFCFLSLGKLLVQNGLKASYLLRVVDRILKRHISTSNQDLCYSFLLLVFQRKTEILSH